MPYIGIVLSGMVVARAINMPQTAAGKTVMAKFLKRYGSKKGKSVFYGSVNSNPKFAKAMGESSVYQRGHPNG